MSTKQASTRASARSPGKYSSLQEQADIPLLLETLAAIRHGWRRARRPLPAASVAFMPLAPPYERCPVAGMAASGLYSADANRRSSIDNPAANRYVIPWLPGPWLAARRRSSSRKSVDGFYLLR